MSENKQDISIDKEINTQFCDIEDVVIPVEDKIPPKERGDFQNFLMTKMGVNRGEENHMMQSKWVTDYAKKVSLIIDNKNRKDNEIIRPLIMSGEYDVASKYVMEALGYKYH